MISKILRLTEVKEMTGLSRSTIYVEMAKSKFPKQVKLTGGQSVGWHETDIVQWIETRKRALCGLCCLNLNYLPAMVLRRLNCKRFSVIFWLVEWLFQLSPSTGQNSRYAVAHGALRETHCGCNVGGIFYLPNS